jgi:hypothetical protein
MPFARILEQKDGTADFIEELAAQKRALRFIPAGSFLVSASFGQQSIFSGGSCIKMAGSIPMKPRAYLRK